MGGSYVWIITMTAVYDHGCAGVFTTRQAAVEHAEALNLDSDGHHDWRVEPFTLDEPIDIAGRTMPWAVPERGGGRVVVSEADDAG